MQQVPYEGSTNIGRHRANCITHGELVPGIFEPQFPPNFGNKYPTTRPNNLYKNQASL
jgi:hypothetical protein